MIDRLSIAVKENVNQSPGNYRLIAINPVEALESDRACHLADKLMVSSRLNAEFLNYHLGRLSSWLDPAPVIENTFYLGYTIGVKSQAPFTAGELRRWLNHHGIETRDRYTFWADPSATYAGPALARINSENRKKSKKTNKFCLPCHASLTIVELLHMVQTITAFFNRSWLGGRVEQKLLND